MNQTLSDRSEDFPSEDDSSEVKPRLRGVSHKYGFFVALICGLWLIFAASPGDPRLAAVIYIFSLCGLLGTSACYHTITWRPRVRPWIRRLDHVMIGVLIAGSITPFFMLRLHSPLSDQIFFVLWLCVGVGAVLNLVWASSPKWLRASIFILMGWVTSPLFNELVESTTLACGLWMMVGGLFYTGGAVVYASQRPDPRPMVFGYHEIFHICVLLGAAIHFGCIAHYIILPAS
jgi:hemolysin III